jgi:hypothetical protein
MATTNQRNKGNGRKQSSARRAAKEGRQSITDMREEMSGYLSQGASQVRDITKDHEGTAVLVAFAAGVGMGLLIGGALAASHSRPKRWTDRLNAEGLGHRLMERVEGMIPQVLSEHFSR